jgi:glyoxylase-like metal-dependent hydrolase (beta-lactamase superfamily II)
MKTVAIALCALTMTGQRSVALAQDVGDVPSDRAITLLRDDLYQVRDGQEYTIFLVTRDGIILGDPLRRATALWLKPELDIRFPGRPVRFVLLSHHHVDRAEGASVFNDTAEIVGNRAFNAELNATRGLMPDLYRFVNNVESTYDSRRTIVLGGRTVELVATEWVHSPDMTLLYFPGERFAFAVDPPQVNVVPFRFGAYRPGDVFKWIHAVAPLEFEVLLTGNGERIARTELVDLGEYLDTLRDGVAARYEQGDSLAQIQANSFLDSHAANPHYAGRAVHIATVHRTLRLIRLEISGSALVHYDDPNAPAYCTLYTFCAAGGAVAAGTASAALLFGARGSLALELTFGEQSWSSRSRASFDEEVVLRRARGAVLFRYAPRLGTFSYALVGGMSHTLGEVRGQNYVAGAVVPVGGFHTIEKQYSRNGFTVGVDLRHRLGAGLTLVAPVRVTRLTGPSPPYWPRNTDIQMGIGIGMQVFRLVN